ncbi:MAG: dihydrofolate synthase / folylpolyglutamate synthase [Chloroflexota bacterium]|nr:dihydrofolate synthase / folylpolyglutamate synthase [Chloroflexota bacterium]
MSVEPAVYLASLPDIERGASSIEMGLHRIRALLDALGRPDKCYPSILIAGTKGKGSTAAMTERSLRAAGYRTGLYTQPHLHTIRERVRVDGAMLTPDEFAAAMARVRGAVERVPGPTTAYDVMTALALDWFASQGVDVAVLEVGLGGRLDATNAVAAQLAVLTSISLDHTQILGSTVDAIAREKADIVKVGRPCVSAPQPLEAMAVIRSVAAQRGAPLVVAGTDDAARWDPDRPWDLLTPRGRLVDLAPALRGVFQRTNVLVATTVLQEIDRAGFCHVPLDAARWGIEAVVWPGRFEVLDGVPPIVIDGAHNVESAQLLRVSLEAAFPGRGIVLVLGIMSDKDRAGIVQALLPAAHVMATRAHNPRAVDPAEIAALAIRHGVPATTSDSVGEALELARTRAGPDSVVVVTGSLYVVGEAREALGLAEPSAEPPYNPWASVR